MVLLKWLTNRQVDGWTGGDAARISLVRAVCASLVLALLPGITAAQEALPTVDQIMADVQDTEVYITGSLGVGGMTPVTDFWLVLPDGTELSVIFDLAEPVGTRLQGCYYSPGKGGTPCAVKGYGFVQWSGPVLWVTLTGIEEISAPAAME